MTVYPPTRKSTVWMPARGMVSQTTNGPATGTVELATNQTMVTTLDFDSVTIEYAQFSVGFPKSWNGGTITFIPIWTASGGVAAETVAWALQAKSLVDGDDLDGAWGTPVSVSDSFTSLNKEMIGAESAVITILGTKTWPSEQRLRIYRDTAADNLSVDAKLVGVWVLFTEDSYTDA